MKRSAVQSAEEATFVIRAHADRSAFGHRLRYLRDTIGMEQGTLAAKAKLSASYLCGVERGQRPAPARPVIERIAEALSLRDAELTEFLDLGQRARQAWNVHACLLRGERREHARRTADHNMADAVEQALNAFRNGWCARLEISASPGGAPLRVTLWPSATRPPMEVPM